MQARHSAVPRALIAILDDDVQFCRTARMFLEPEFEVETFSEEDGLFRSLRHQEPDLLLLDVLLAQDVAGERTGFDVLATLKEKGFHFPVVILTVLAGMDVTRRAASLGIPFLQKDASFNSDIFRQTVHQVLALQRLRQELEYLRGSVRLPGETDECPWPGSASGRKVLDQLAPFIEGTLPLLLQGEIGTGKRTTASWIHSRIRGADSPFVVLPCPELQTLDRIEEELFGTESRRRPYPNGLLRSADGGTIYIGGFDRIPVHVVSRLQAAIVSGFYTPHGGSRRVRLGCRVIAGSNSPEVMAGWPEDLQSYWRPLCVELPPMRDHMEDLEFHLDFIGRALKQEGCQPRELDAGAVKRLRSLGLRRNFIDLRSALIQGVEFVESRRQSPDGQVLDWDGLARKSRMEFDDYVHRKYLVGVRKLIGMNVDRWIEHTGYSRTTIFAWWKLMAAEDPDWRSNRPNEPEGGAGPKRRGP